MQPKILIASSREGYKIAEALQFNFNRVARCKIWDQIFPASSTTIDALLNACNEHDFAIFVFSKDDIAQMRGQTYSVPRDNVVFESGLFIGMHGRDCGFVVIPQNEPDLHLPTDLLGFTVVDYDANWAKKESEAALKTAYIKITRAIATSTWAKSRLNINAKVTETAGRTFPLKLEVALKNDKLSTVLVESISFEVDSPLKLAANCPNKKSADTCTPEFIVRMEAGSPVYDKYCVLKPNESVSFWVPIEENLGKKTLDDALAKAAVGKWEFRCSWLNDHIITLKYENQF